MVSRLQARKLSQNWMVSCLSSLNSWTPESVERMVRPQTWALLQFGQVTLEVVIKGEKVSQQKSHVDSGVYRQITSLLGQMESWVSRFDASISPETMSVSDWLNLEKALQSWQSSVEKVLQSFSSLLPEEAVDDNNPDTS